MAQGSMEQKIAPLLKNFRKKGSWGSLRIPSKRYIPEIMRLPHGLESRLVRQYMDDRRPPGGAGLQDQKPREAVRRNVGDRLDDAERNESFNPAILLTEPE